MPNHVEDHVSISGIAIVAVSAPAGGMQINFDITGARRLAGEPQNGAAKIGTRLVIPETGMKNPHRLAVECL